MNTWVDEDPIIEEHGGYVQPLMNDDYPVIDYDNPEEVVSLLATTSVAHPAPFVLPHNTRALTKETK